jgi:hypothetical protein
LLLAKYVELDRELGHLPVDSELRLKARSDPMFPNHTTFARLGVKSDCVKRVAEYCQSVGGYADILSMCQAYVPPAREVAEERDAPRVEIGFVYLIKSGRFYKIGRTNAAGRREREIALQLPEKATTIHIIRTDDPVGIEAYWYKRFEGRRKNGEWFELSVADVAAFRRRKFMQATMSVWHPSLGFPHQNAARMVYLFLNRDL